MQREAGSDHAGSWKVSGAKPGVAEKVFEWAAEGPRIGRLQDALDLIGEARSAGATLVVIPMSRLAPAFFELRSGLAGEILQKFVIYQLRVAILGDATAMSDASKSLRDFIREANRGNAVWFVPSLEELDRRLASAGPDSSDAAGS